jgi:hypothetical protein
MNRYPIFLNPHPPATSYGRHAATSRRAGVKDGVEAGAGSTRWRSGQLHWRALCHRHRRPGRGHLRLGPRGAQPAGPQPGRPTASGRAGCRLQRAAAPGGALHCGWLAGGKGVLSPPIAIQCGARSNMDSRGGRRCLIQNSDHTVHIAIKAWQHLLVKSELSAMVMAGPSIKIDRHTASFDCSEEPFGIETGLSTWPGSLPTFSQLHSRRSVFHTRY